MPRKDFKILPTQITSSCAPNTEQKAKKFANIGEPPGNYQAPKGQENVSPILRRTPRLVES